VKTISFNLMNISFINLILKISMSEKITEGAINVIIRVADWDPF